MLVPSGDAVALADGICAVLDNPPDIEPVRELMVERYGIERLVRDLNSLYHGLLTKKLRLGAPAEESR
jgi:hypothetical protein